MDFFKKILPFAVSLFCTLNISANNIAVTNVARTSVNTSLDYAYIRFSVSWDNSWRDAANYDAAWLFIKYRLQGSTSAWNHATIHYVDGVNDTHTLPAGATINTSPDGKGVFIFRSNNGNGTANFANAELRWDYGADGVADNALVEVSVHAIEMVYVPQGSFWLGDGSNTNIQGNFESGISGLPYNITSESTITLGGGGAGSLGNNNRTGMANEALLSLPGSIDDFSDVATQILSAAFPKGFGAFYCMKYEITQAQYADFLNRISFIQFSARYDALNYTSTYGGFTQTRYNITGIHPNLTSISPDIPAVFTEWYDAAAYADWAALRPMTELEFEKACRGTLAPVANEFAWGTATVTATNYFPVINFNLPNESINNGYNIAAGNAWFTNSRAFDAAVRVGIFAANNNNTGRITSGATFWGIMEMSGNCWERTVTVGRPEGRNFAGSHGDGNLFTNGNATNADWPGYTASFGVNNAFGCGYRGGGFNFPNPTQLNMRVSSRILATAFYNIRYYDDAARFVRTVN